MIRPACGLMTTDLPKRLQPKSAPSDNWHMLATVGHAADLPLVFFHPHDIDLKRRTVTGYIWNPQSGWRTGTHYVPRVIIDNVIVSVARRDQTYAANKRALQRMDVTVLNPRLPDKWGVWQALRAYAPLAKHLPETELLQRTQDLAQWLAQYETVYVKPVRGSGGQGVMQIKQTAQQKYLVSGKNHAQMTRAELHTLAAHLLASEKEKHLLQRGLPLLEVEKRKLTC
ncbi:MAG: YheC/YheD family protein, partial [Tumebacillaceae bacterium]